nr:YoaP domain-containing protein [uncultured Streptococcus sp.]
MTTYAFFYNREYVTNEQMNAKKNLKLVSKVKG